MERTNTKFKQQFERFWEPQKAAPRPLCFLSDPKLFRLVLKSRIFSLTADLIFQFFVGEAWGERRIIFCMFKGHQNYESIMLSFFLYFQYYTAARAAAAPPREPPWRRRPSRPRRRLRFFGFAACQTH